MLNKGSENLQCKIRDVVLWATSFLGERGIETPRLEAEMLAAQCLNIDRACLLARMQETFPEQAREPFCELVKRRGEHYPLQYLTGTQDFMGMEFSVVEGVLIPRGDTEVLVETVLDLIQDSLNKGQDNRGSRGTGGSRDSRDSRDNRDYRDGASEKVRSGDMGLRDRHQVDILEVGTGSGIIAVSIAAYLSSCRITAVDISAKALDLAVSNARKFGVEDRVDFILADIFHWLPDKDKEYDVIVSNPPYISAKEMQELQQEVFFEPGAALFGGESGLDFYFRLANLAAEPYLKDNGMVAVEIGWQQAEAVKGIFAAAGFKDITVIQDYGGRDRVIVCRKGKG